MSERTIRPDARWTTLRALTAALGAWVLASVFLWHHTRAEAINGLVVGAAVILFAGLAERMPRARYASAAAAVWLFASWVPLHPATMGTVYNDWIFGILIALASLGPDLGRPRRLEQAARGA